MADYNFTASTADKKTVTDGAAKSRDSLADRAAIWHKLPLETKKKLIDADPVLEANFDHWKWLEDTFRFSEVANG